MPINPNILLQGQIADIGKAVGQGLEAYQQSRQNVLLERQDARQTEAARLQAETNAIANELNLQKLQQAQIEADALIAAKTASDLKPFIINKDYEGFVKALQKSSVGQEDRDVLDTYARANRWDNLNTIADQYIQTGRDIGVYAKDSTSGYTPSGITYYNELQRLQAVADSLPPNSEERKRAQANVEMLAGIIRQSQTYAGGGGTTVSTQPLTGTTRTLPVTDTGEPPPAPPITGTGAVDQAVLNQPIEGGAGEPVQDKSFKEAADVTIARRNAKLRAAETLADREAIRMEGYQFDVDTHQKMRSGLTAAFGKEGFGAFFKDLPQGRVSSAVNSAVSAFMGGTKGRDAEARMAQLSRLFLQGVPYDPGAQSNAELTARAELVGDLQNPDISVQQKINSINTYYRFLDARAESSREKLSEYYGRNPAMTAPSNVSAPVTGQPTMKYVNGQLIRIGGQ